MSSSFFQRLYKRREMDRNQKEDFLTEIFAHCLSVDEGFRKDFLKKIEVEDPSGFSCTTQSTCENMRFDVLAETTHHRICMECKVHSREGQNQLSKYNDYLTRFSDKSKTLLVYLTKHHESVRNPPTGMKHLRWHQIHAMAENSQHPLTVELTAYLKSERMDKSVSLNQADLNRFKDYRDMVSNMRDFVVEVKEELSCFGKLKIDENERSGYLGVTLKVKDEIYLWAGFLQFANDQEMRFCVSLECPPNYRDAPRLKKLLKDYSHYLQEDGSFVWFRDISSSKFFDEESFNGSELLKFSKKHFSELKNALEE